MSNTERWLAGPVEKIPGLLQPVAHALLQAEKEIRAMMIGFNEDNLWVRPGELASVGFHLQHIKGVLDRLFTYARGEALSGDQLNYLKAEGEATGSVKSMLEGITAQVGLSLLQLEQTDENTLTAFRGVGRKQTPSTVIGLLFHAAEHTMRHVGQMLVTVKLLPSCEGGERA